HPPPPQISASGRGRCRAADCFAGHVGADLSLAAGYTPQTSERLDDDRVCRELQGRPWSTPEGIPVQAGPERQSLRKPAQKKDIRPLSSVMANSVMANSASGTVRPSTRAILSADEFVPVVGTQPGGRVLSPSCL